MFALAVDLLVAGLSANLTSGLPGSESLLLICASRNCPKSVRSSQRYAISRRSDGQDGAKIFKWFSDSHGVMVSGDGEDAHTFALFVEV